MTNAGQGRPTTRTELVWESKYDEQGRPRPVERIAPAHSDHCGHKRAQGKGEGWRNKLIWGDSKYVMASLLEEFAATYRNPRRVNAGTSLGSLKQDRRM